jgi:hypothetical protein
MCCCCYLFRYGIFPSRGMQDIRNPAMQRAQHQLDHVWWLRCTVLYEIPGKMPAKIPGVNLTPIINAVHIPPHELVLAQLLVLSTGTGSLSPQHIAICAQSTGAGSLSRALLSPGSQSPASFSRSLTLSAPSIPSIDLQQQIPVNPLMNLRQACMQRCIMLSLILLYRASRACLVAVSIMVEAFAGSVGRGSRIR